MGIEENKKVVRRYIEAGNTGEYNLLDELLTDNFIQHRVDSGASVDREGMKQSNIAHFQAASDYHVIIEDMIAEGDKVVVMATGTGTHEGTMGNMSVTSHIVPTGNKLRITRMGIYRLENGKIAESWLLNDRLTMFQQMGILPPTEELGK